MFIMKKLKLYLFAFLISCVFISGISAKETEETQIAKDVKKALQSYAGLTELNKRGFKLTDLDSATSLKEVYNILLPYMVQNDISLDNAIGFYDKKHFKIYSFNQHYTVHFTDDYGSKSELKKKGYKDNEIFAYFSKGNELYRGGKFVWEKAKNYPGVSSWNIPKAPPIVADNFIYFWPLYYTEKFYPDYWKQASSKAYIILDMRLNQGGDYPASLFFDYLDSVSYKGHVIIIIDGSSNTGEWLLSTCMTKWVNGKEVPRSFTYTSVGENTPGFSNFSGIWQIYETDDFRAWGIRTEINKWKTFDEGVGLMPDIWAENSADICKTIEVLTGIKDISKKIAVYQNFIDNLMIESEPFAFSFPRLESLYQLKDDNVFIETLSKYEEIKKRWYDLCFENKEKCTSMKGNLIGEYNSKLLNADKTLPLNEYLTKLDKLMDETIISTKRYLGQLRKDKSIPEHKLSKKEIDKLYKSYKMSMVDIPGKEIKMLSTEVTQKLFETLMGYNPSEDKAFHRDEKPDGPEYNPDENIKDDYPVVNVSWLEAIYFCNRLSEKFGFTPVYAMNDETDVEKWDYCPHCGSWGGRNWISQNLEANGFRLPTAEEWNFAAKGGENYTYAGSDNLNEVGWYDDNSGYKLHSVAQKKPNGYGLYDMSGSVAERTNDTQYGNLTYGGSYSTRSEYCIIDGKTFNSTDSKINYWENIGFRIVCASSKVFKKK